MSAVMRWVVIVVAAVVLVAMVAYARGKTHQRGDDVGAMSAGRHVVTAPATAGR